MAIERFRTAADAQARDKWMTVKREGSFFYSFHPAEIGPKETLAEAYEQERGSRISECRGCK